MKRKLSAVFLCLILVVSLALGASASIPKVEDTLGLLLPDELFDLETQAQSLTDRYGMDVALLIVDDLGSLSPDEYADMYYDTQGYSDNGILFLLSMAERDWCIYVSGEAQEVLTEFNRESVFSAAAPYLGENEFYDGFCAYLNALPMYFEAYESGDPLDILTGTGEESEGPSWMTVVIALIVGLVVGAITILIMVSNMDTTDDQRSASDYLRSDSYDLRNQTDTFLYSSVTKTARPKPTNSSGGGGSSHSSSSGKF